MQTIGIAIGIANYDRISEKLLSNFIVTFKIRDDKKSA